VLPGEAMAHSQRHTYFCIVLPF